MNVKKIINIFFQIISIIIILSIILFLIFNLSIDTNEKKEIITIKKEEKVKEEYSGKTPFKTVEIKNYGNLDLSVLNKNNIQVSNNSNLTVILKESELSECNESFVFHSKQNCKGN